MPQLNLRTEDQQVGQLLISRGFIFCKQHQRFEFRCSATSSVYQFALRLLHDGLVEFDSDNSPHVRSTASPATHFTWRTLLNYGMRATLVIVVILFFFLAIDTPVVPSVPIPTLSPEQVNPEIVLLSALPVLPSSTPTLLPSATPVVVTPTPLLPTATLNAEDRTAWHVVTCCLGYLPSIIRHNAEFPEIGPDLVIAMASQESSCDPSADDGVSVGFLAVTPREWIAPREALFGVDLNIYVGMWLLHMSLADEDHNPTHDMHRALGAYNCGWVSLEANNCYAFGGFAYADRVLNFWLPHARAALDYFCSLSFGVPSRQADQVWLRDHGYCQEVLP